MRFPFFHVPHDGTRFPEELMGTLCVSRKELLDYHEKMRDAGVWETIPGQYRDREHSEKFDVSRLLCDVERFIGPEEVMERFGMGFCYERAYDGRKIRNLDGALKERTMVYYRRHHDRMDRLCFRNERILLFDLHSYSDEIVPEEFRKGLPELPDLCLGTDPVFTPEKLVRLAEDCFREAGCSVKRNVPYAGCFIPNAVMSGQSGCCLAAIMLEWNRRVLCRDDGSPDPVKTGKIREIMGRLTAEGMKIE